MRIIVTNNALGDLIAKDLVELSKPIPEDCILHDLEYLGAFNGEKRWRSHKGKLLYTWDALHGEIEVFSKRGKHVEVLHPDGSHNQKQSKVELLMSNFIQDCLRGKALLDDIDDYIDVWHASDSDLNLHDFLGMTNQEFHAWVRDPDVLPQIIKAKRNKLASEGHSQISAS